MNFYIKHGLLVIVSVVIVLSTVAALSEPVKNKEELSRVSFGFPYTFLAQNFESELERGTFLFFPNHYRLSFSFEAQPISDFSFFRFIADFLIIFGTIEALVFLLERGKGFLMARKMWPYSRAD